jgi:dynein heavy chain
MQSLLTSVPPGALPGMAHPSARVAVPEPQSGGVAWRPALVLDCDEAADTFLVQLTRQPGSSGAAGGCEGNPAAVLRLPRVCVCFAAEDPAVYATRYVRAHAARAEAEALMRYNLTLGCMPTAGMPQLTTEQVGEGARACHSGSVRAFSLGCMVWRLCAGRIKLATASA